MGLLKRASSSRSSIFNLLEKLMHIQLTKTKKCLTTYVFFFLLPPPFFLRYPFFSLSVFLVFPSLRSLGLFVSTCCLCFPRTLSYVYIKRFGFLVVGRMRCTQRGRVKGGRG